MYFEIWFQEYNNNQEIKMVTQWLRDNELIDSLFMTLIRLLILSQTDQMQL